MTPCCHGIGHHPGPAPCAKQQFVLTSTLADLLDGFRGTEPSALLSVLLATVASAVRNHTVVRGDDMDAS